MSHVNALYHVVFATYMRENTIAFNQREHLYRFIWELSQQHKCRIHRINGTQNHIHILLDLHPTLSLSWFIGEIKRRSSRWMKDTGLFPLFAGWAREYFAMTCSPADKNNAIEYIRNQATHHGYRTFNDELRSFCTEAQIPWNDLYLS